MRKKRIDPPPPEPRQFQSVQEIDLAIARLRRRETDLQQLDVTAAIAGHTGADDIVSSNIRRTILEVFGVNSPEYREHQSLRLWGGPIGFNMGPREIAHSTELGRTHALGVVRGLIASLTEKREELTVCGTGSPSTYFDELNLHPRIAGVCRDLFLDGYHSEAVFAASKSLVNYVKDRSGKHDLDGAPLMRSVFSRNDPILAFNDLTDQTDKDEQEGMMHLFEGAVLGIRNPGGHAFPEGTEQRAIEYISFLSLLAYRVQESKQRKIR